MQALWLFLALAPLATQPPLTWPGSMPHELNAEGVTALLTVMDVVAALHPDFATREESISRLSAVDRRRALEQARARNEKSVELASAIESLFRTETYRVYFRRYPNVSADDLREIILDLPYVARPAPGGLGDTYYDLLRHRDDARSALERLLRGLDLEEVYRIARRWSPAGATEPPTLYLIYDSNAGSYTAEGKPFYNIYSSGTLEAMNSVREEDPLLTAQGTMAHELQHVMSEDVLYGGETGDETDRPWRAAWLDRLTRGMVGEGVANHCNPPEGIKREVYEDTMVVAALVSRLNEMLNALAEGDMAEEDMRHWYRANYFEAAETLLRAHFQKTYSGAKLEAMLKQYMHVRPDLEHVLGWWMTSRISQHGTLPGRAVALLSDPYTTYRLYNETISSDHPELKIAPDAVRYLGSFRKRSG